MDRFWRRETCARYRVVPRHGLRAFRNHYRVLDWSRDKFNFTWSRQNGLFKGNTKFARVFWSETCFNEKRNSVRPVSHSWAGAGVLFQVGRYGIGDAFGYYAVAVEF